MTLAAEADMQSLSKPNLLVDEIDRYPLVLLTLSYLAYCYSFT